MVRRMNKRYINVQKTCQATDVLRKKPKKCKGLVRGKRVEIEKACSPTQRAQAKESNLLACVSVGKHNPEEIGQGVAKGVANQQATA